LPAALHQTMISREPTIDAWPRPVGSVDAVWPDRGRFGPGAGRHRHPCGGRCRPVLPVHPRRGWSLEEGIVKTGSFSIDQGVGVRAVSGEKTAFATPMTSRWRRCWSRLRRCAIGAAKVALKLAKAKLAGSRRLYADLDPIATLDSPTRCSCWSRSNAGPRQGPARGPGHGGPGREYDVVLVARLDGTSPPMCARWCACR
jgi:TldD protein